MLEDPQYKEELVQMIEKDPLSMNKVLKRLEQLISQDEGNMAEIFEKKYFRSYVYLVDQYFRIHKQSLNENLDSNIKIIQRMAKIYYYLGNLTFQKQDLLTKKIINIAIEQSRKLEFSQVHQLLFCMATFNIRRLNNEDNLFIRLKEILQKEKDIIQMDDIVEIHFNLARISTNRINQDKNAILVLMDMVNSIIYDKRDSLTFSNVTRICASIQKADAYVNKHLLSELVKILRNHIITNKLDSQKISENVGIIKQHIQTFGHITFLENTISNGLFYMYDFDEYYQLITVLINNWIDSFSPRQLGDIASNLQRISHYDSKLIMKIANKIMQFDFYGFEQNDESSEIKKQLKEIRNQMDNFKKNENQKQEKKEQQSTQNGDLINLQKQERILKVKLERIEKKIKQNFNNLNALIKVVHCLGAFNIRGDNKIKQEDVNQFLNYFYSVIELFTLKFQQEKTTGVHLDPKNITRSIWALCVLDTPGNIAIPLNSLINKFLFNEENSLYSLNQADLSILFYAYLYLQKNPGVFPQQLVQIIHSLYTQQILKSKKAISQFCYDVKKQIDKLQIPNNLEIKIDNILVDIIIPEQFLGKQIALDVHGYMHYFRNEEILKGNSNLKKKIIEQYYSNIYVIIPQFEWELLDKQHKLEYIENLFKTLQQRAKQEQLIK